MKLLNFASVSSVALLEAIIVRQRRRRPVLMHSNDRVGEKINYLRRNVPAGNKKSKAKGYFGLFIVKNYS